MTFSSTSLVPNRYASSNTFFSSNSAARYYLQPNIYWGSSLGTSLFLYTKQGGSFDFVTFVNSNNSTLASTNSSYSSDYSNYVIVNNDTNNWNLTLPLGPGGGTNTWISSTFQITIKKTGSGTVTIQTPSDTIGTRIRGINTTSNKSFVLSSSNPQTVKLVYTYGKTNTGTTDETAEIWYVLKDVSSNPTSSNGSLLFAGNASSYLTVVNDTDFRFGTGDFTIEWWQYQTDSNANPRIFSMGTYPSASIGVSIEGGTFYFWIGGAPNSLGSAGTYKNVYTHFAIVRSGTTIKVFKNGTQLGSNITSSYNFNDTTNDLRIGNEQSLTSSSGFGGNIKGFHWVKGTALYSTTFTPNYNSITPHANSKLLLNVANSAGLVTDSSGVGKTVTNTNVTFSSITHPFY